MSELLDRLTIDPAVRSGKPVIRDTRITVSDILEYLASGMSEEEIIADFPDLTHEDLLATLAFAAQREQKKPPPRLLQILAECNLTGRFYSSNITLFFY